MNAYIRIVGPMLMGLSLVLGACASSGTPLAAHPTALTREEAPHATQSADLAQAHLPELEVSHQIKPRKGPEVLHKLTVKCDAERLREEHGRLKGGEQAIVAYSYTLVVDANTRVMRHNLTDPVLDCIQSRAGDVQALLESEGQVEVQFAALLYGE